MAIPVVVLKNSKQEADDEMSSGLSVVLILKNDIC